MFQEGDSMTSGSSLTISMLHEFEVVCLRLDSLQRRLTSEEFERFALQNPDLRIEMNRQGELIVMSPTTMKDGQRNFLLTGRLLA
jgi:Uma2 family endonuclease